ncbi:MAG: cytochrome c [Chloroflexi bacterium]|nr:cytochrome c [Chloroflexota bacterium]
MGSQGSIWQRGLAGGLGLFLLAIVWAFAAASAGAEEGQERADQGKAIFGQNCAGCHAFGRVMVGPDLQGVTQRRQESWLKVQIQSPSAHRAQNDPIAKANLEQFRIPMPDLGLTNEQVEAMLAYLKSTETKATDTAPSAIPNLYFLTLAIGGLAVAGITIIGLVVGTKRVEVRR